MRTPAGMLLAWLLHRTFAVLATLYLLVPPGYCLCHGFNDMLPSPTTNAGQPEEHVPGCPASKTPYLHQADNPVPVQDVSLAAAVVVAATTLPPFLSLPAQLDSIAESSAPPIYLALRALRI